MAAMTVREQKNALRHEIATWQACVVGLFALSVFTNLALCGLYAAERRTWQEERLALHGELQQMERTRDHALEQLGALSLETERERESRATQAAEYEAVGAWEYIGECRVTAYCPCELCCGKWADGRTASGLPAGPGVVAVDSEIVPLGSTVIIDGQQYLAADTGVTGLHVDICMAGHAAAEAFGVQNMDVWVAAR